SQIEQQQDKDNYGQADGYPHQRPTLFGAFAVLRLIVTAVGFVVHRSTFSFVACGLFRSRVLRTVRRRPRRRSAGSADTCARWVRASRRPAARIPAAARRACCPNQPALKRTGCFPRRATAAAAGRIPGGTPDSPRLCSMSPAGACRRGTKSAREAGRARWAEAGRPDVAEDRR